MATIDAHGRYILCPAVVCRVPTPTVCACRAAHVWDSLYAMRGLSALSVSTIRQCESLEGGMGSSESHAFLFVEAEEKEITVRDFWDSIGTF